MKWSFSRRLWLSENRNEIPRIVMAAAGLLCFPSCCPIGWLRSGHPRSKKFSLGVVPYEMFFDAPAGRVTDETGLLSGWPIIRELKRRLALSGGKAVQQVGTKR